MKRAVTGKYQMKTTKYLLALILYITITPYTYADSATKHLNPNNESPIGYLEPAMEIGTNKTIPLLDSPYGKQIGTLKTFLHDDLCLKVNTYQGKSFGRLSHEKDKWYMGSYGGLVYCDYLAYFDIDADHARILANSIEGGVWLNMKALHDNKDKTSNRNLIRNISFKDIDWMASLIKHNLLWVNGYHNYRLRKSPEINSDIIILLNEEIHLITEFTGKRHNGWAEAIVYEVSSRPDHCFDMEEVIKVWTKRKWKGWIKVLNENGMPHKITWGGNC